jgi:hypothetical protein
LERALPDLERVAFIGVKSLADVLVSAELNESKLPSLTANGRLTSGDSTARANLVAASEAREPDVYRDLRHRS